MKRFTDYLEIIQEESKTIGTFKIPTNYWHFMQIDETNWERISAQTFNKILSTHLPYENLDEYMGELHDMYSFNGDDMKPVYNFKHYGKGGKGKGIVLADNLVNAGINILSILMKKDVEPAENTKYLQEVLQQTRLKHDMTAIHPFDVEKLVNANPKTYADLKALTGWNDWLTPKDGANNPILKRDILKEIDRLEKQSKHPDIMFGDLSKLQDKIKILRRKLGLKPGTKI